MRFDIVKPILAFMTELDAIWSQMLLEAGAQASERGSHHVAEYLRLRASNDAIRARGVAWLIDVFIELATDAQRDNPNIKIERVEPHEFALGSSTMVGTQLFVRHGVRCLTIEAGWARIPIHGIMRKGALAVASITHFGVPNAGVSIRLVHNDDDVPRWIDDDDARIDTSVIERHIDVLIDKIFSRKAAKNAKDKS